MFAACHKLSVALAQPDLGFPAAVLDHFGLLFEPQLQVSTAGAGYRYAQAPSTSASWAWVLPALVIEPRWRRSPEEYSEGIKPKNFMSSLGVSNRLRSPSSATIVTATVYCPPRRA
jgi:hypothetical protein